jgi:hypothetical protein
MSFRGEWMAMAMVLMGATVLTAGVWTRSGERESTGRSDPLPAPVASPAEPPAPPSDGQPQATAPEVEPASAPTTGPAETVQEPQAAAGTASQPMAVEDHEQPGVQVALMDVKRTSGDTVTVRLQFRNTTPKDVSNNLFYATALIEGMYLLDGESKKKHLVIRDAEDKPVGWVGRSRTIPAKGVLPVWARFPAPPATVTKITVAVPGAPPFEDVPIK